MYILDRTIRAQVKHFSGEQGSKNDVEWRSLKPMKNKNHRTCPSWHIGSRTISYDATRDKQKLWHAHRNRRHFDYSKVHKGRYTSYSMTDDKIKKRVKNKRLSPNTSIRQGFVFKSKPKDYDPILVSDRSLCFSYAVCKIYTWTSNGYNFLPA